jgi:hypothetical protein
MEPRSRPSYSTSYDDKPRYKLAITTAIIALVILGASAFWVTNALHGQSSQGKITPSPPVVGPTQPPPTPTLDVNPTGPISPLIFGTNLGLFNDTDQVVQSEATRTLMAQLHIKIVRMPSRRSLAPQVMIQAAQAIKEIGAVPLIVLHGTQTPDTMLADDIAVVKNMNSVFGNSTVYYEFGNEDDNNGVDVNHYIAGWNMVIPQLKAIAPQAHFIGPVNYQYDANYLTTFLKNVQVQPDEISWHEYTCDVKWTNDRCLNNIDNWTTHILGARQLMANTIGKILPIMITEWNYTAAQTIQPNGQPISDGKYDNTQFITDWTTKALKTLADNRVFASMQYSVTNTALPMITYSNTVTLQGSIFQSFYQQMFPGGS